jgi:hypothetical protein
MAPQRSTLKRAKATKYTKTRLNTNEVSPKRKGRGPGVIRQTTPIEN